MGFFDNNYDLAPYQLNESGGFDSEAYLAANPDVAAAGMDAYDHYQRYGQNEGRQGFFIQSAYDKLSSSASPNGWSPDVGNWFNGVDQRPYNAAIDGKVGAPVPRSRFDDFLNAHQINEDERDSYYNGYLNQFNNAQQEQQQYQADPKGYTNQKAQSLADELFGEFTHNGQWPFTGKREPLEAQLNAMKQADPAAYYNAQLSLDLRKAGWDAGQNKTNDVTNARIQENINNAINAGLSTDQIQGLIANNYANTAQWHATNIAQRQGQGATLQGIEKVAPAFAAMITAGALAPAAAAMEAGAVGAGAAGEIAGGSLYTGAGTFAGEGLGTAAELMGPTYGELGYTGLEAGQFGPTYGEMGYTGLNQGQAIAGADAISQSRQALDALRYGNQARQALGYGNTIAKLLGIGGSASGATGSAVGGATPSVGGGNLTSGLSPQDLAKYLSGMASPAQAGAIPYQIKMNQNPFTFDIPGQTKATEGMYDVSGMNPMANALRKA
jgi:hypothetical protein